MTDVLKIEKTGAIATITLNRPEAFNAFDAALRTALKNAVADINEDDAVRVVILKGEGRGFCAGADLKGGLGGSIEHLLESEFRPSLIGIAHSPKIWIAQVHGSAAGIGAAYAMCCDMVVMADTASLYMAFASIALIPDGGNTWLLLKAMGYHRALQTILEGKKITAQQCLDHGLINQIASDDQLEAETQALAARIANTAPLAAAAAKRLLRKVGEGSFGDAFSAEAQEQGKLVKSADFREGVSAFIEKRKPVFTGA
ncbi:enoyl-CoA hydratase/isomerase family protein [Thalassovita taeanensis]|uniref:2-(1,2-epoxy-1,2-dihydrophenyl)acetyl-CoA isomerase n=1 Tax=Thalassovita taeanensis TaxID=657014 RepID=A0A1H9AI86_9RHOB|nr:enoyl-CoA hydratase-related protein [Thalassovita taeanensis]SEP76454.1 2-(1,2-epoxy-1,2-dihydrophenyl)acetyl-CoA isomerase [Thalassovita taeanensis]